MTSGLWNAAVGDQHLEGVVSLAVPAPEADPLEAGAPEEFLQFGGREPEAGVPQPFADPLLLVLEQVEDEHAAARRQDAARLGEAGRGILEAVEKLGEHRDVDRAVGQGEALDVALAPADVADAAPLRAAARAADRDGIAVDADDPLGPRGDLEGEL